MSGSSKPITTGSNNTIDITSAAKNSKLPPTSNSPPRPQVPPGHGGPVRSPHPHDVLSGRGGRINSHPGNVHFREMVDSYKREYLDPRTKKVEKARIAARIVSNVRSLNPPGRFLKEDSHTNNWLEVGDERAWKKSGQALRESAPEIRAEREKVLRGLAGKDADVHLPVSKKKSGGGGRKKTADPPAPRHRPNPPEREGLARSSSSRSNNNNNYNEPELAAPPTSDGDLELQRMRQEYYEMQRMQAEQQRRMEQYQAQLEAAKKCGNKGGGVTNTSDYDRDVYNEYQQMQAGLMNGYRQQLCGLKNNDQQGNERFSNQDIAAAVMDSGLVPGYDGSQQVASASAMGIGQYLPNTNQQQFHHHHQQQQQYAAASSNDNNQGGYNNQLAQDTFGNAHFNACDKTVSTMSSFDVQSMDMSLGNFSWNQNQQSSYNMSGLISTGSTTRNDFNASQRSKSSSNRTSKKSSKSGKSALERKLEKVNEQHRYQQMQEMQRKQQQMMMQGAEMGAIEVPTAGGATWTAQQKANNNNRGGPVRRGTTENMASLNSFGFDAIEEDDITEASYKMSNLGLSEMDMTFSSDVLSVRSKSVPKQRSKEDGDDGDVALKRSSSMDGDEGGVQGSSLSSNESGFNKANNGKYNMDEFNESFKSMEMSRSGDSGGGGEGGEKKKAARDPDGAVGGPQRPHQRRKDPKSGGMLGTIHSSRSSKQQGGVSSSTATTSSDRLPSSNYGDSVDMGISDPDLIQQFGASNTDFGVSMNSLRSFQSNQSNDSNGSWLNQYNSMENVAADKNLWDDEDAAGSSDASNMSQISAPRMGTVGGN